MHPCERWGRADCGAVRTDSLELRDPPFRASGGSVAAGEASGSKHPGLATATTGHWGPETTLSRHYAPVWQRRQRLRLRSCGGKIRARPCGWMISTKSQRLRRRTHARNRKARKFAAKKGTFKPQRKHLMSGGGRRCGRNWQGAGDRFPVRCWRVCGRRHRLGQQRLGGCFSRTPAGRTRALERAGHKGRPRGMPQCRSPSACQSSLPLSTPAQRCASLEKRSSRSAACPLRSMRQLE